MASKILADLETLFAPGDINSEAKLKTLRNLNNIYHNLGFNIFDLTSDPVLTNHREKSRNKQAQTRGSGKRLGIN
jgi:hypothetical protein